MFEPWETFYLLVGTSAAALVGVMFIVMTLTAEVAVEEINRGTVIYQNPTVFHLAVIVAIGALASVPEHLVSVVAFLLLILGILGFLYSALTTRRMYERYEFYTATLADKVVFGILPTIFYLLLGVGALAVWSVPEVAAEAIGAATLLLLLVSVPQPPSEATERHQAQL